jgi:hypothetical protein
MWAFLFLKINNKRLLVASYELAALIFPIYNLSLSPKNGETLKVTRALCHII